MEEKGWSHKSWVKGGFWGILVLIVQSVFGMVLSLIIPAGGPPFSSFYIITGPIISILVFPFAIASLLASVGGLGLIVFLVPIFVYFIIGAIIGWIVWKVKKKRI
jgi:hypothetical protein